MSGKGKAAVVEEITLDDATVEQLNELKKQGEVANWRVVKEQARIYAPLYEKRRALAKTIKGFWPTVINNHGMLQLHLSGSEDAEAISALEDVEIVRSETDPREFTITFHFGENPYFTNKTLVKSYTVHKQAGSSSASAGEPTDDELVNYDPERDLVGSKTTIEWKSPEKDLTKLHPRSGDMEDLNGDDDTPIEPGSFFHLFTEEKDPFDIGSVLLEDLYPSAIDYFLGLGENSLASDDEDEASEDESDVDPNEEIDLDDDEKPKKKRARKN